jgi:hypothetical protein
MESHKDDTDNANAGRSGNFDTLFKSPDFLEDTEGSAVYTSILQKKIAT